VTARGAFAAVALLASSGLWAAPAAKPQRIVSLSVAADEILVEIVQPERIVAATAAGDEEAHSYAAGRLPRSTPRFRKADLERLLALRPDLVIVSEYTDADFLYLLERSGLRWHRMVGLSSLAGLRKALVDLGEAVGEPEASARLALAFDARLAEVSRRTAGAARPRVLYWSNAYTAGADSAIGALIECGGAVNVGHELGLSGLALLGAERAFVAAPDAVLVSGAADAAALRAHPLMGRLRAVREGRVIDMPHRVLVTLSHHAADSCAQLAAAFHPGRFPADAPGAWR
jgi:iron complex transport system substrate-binding protein